MADLQICTCQLIFRTEGLCVPMPKSTRRVRALLPWGFHGEGGRGGVRPPPPHISCFTLKIHVIQLPPSGLAAACCASHLRAPRCSLAPLPVIVADRPRASWGSEVTSDDSRNQPDALGALPTPCVSTGQRELDSSASVNSLAF